MLHPNRPEGLSCWGVVCVVVPRCQERLEKPGVAYRDSFIRVWLERVNGGSLLCAALVSTTTAVFFFLHNMKDPLLLSVYT